MPTRQQAAIQNISPVLFLTFDGEPMTFYLRPGHTRQQLQPMIKAGGGVMCRTQRPGAILLIDPEARSSVSGSNAHLYVSTQYILDCIEKEEQLNVEDYRLTPDDVPKPSTKKDRTKTPSEGRIPYTPDDDTAILEYVKSRKARVGGILLWREMERKRVTGHSWQSMKDRYERRLAKKLLEAVTAESTENVTGSEAEEDQAEDEDNRVFDGEIPSEAAVASPQKHSKESHPEEVCGTTPTNAEDASSSKEEKSENQQTDGAPEETAESETMKAPMSDSSVTEDSSAELHEDVQPGSDEAADPDRDGPQPNISQSPAEDCPHVLAESPVKASTPGKLKDKRKASPATDQPVQRMTRRRLELEAAASSEPYGRKLRSSSSSPAPSPQKSKKTNPVKAARENSPEAEQPPPKRARGNIPAAEEQREPEPEQTTPADKSESPLKKKKKKTKSQLGILELATKEFDDGSESGEEDEEDSNVPDSAETVATSAGRLPPPTDAAGGPRPSQASAVSSKQNGPESPASSDNCVPDTCSLVPAPAKPPVPEPAAVTSKAHLFIFDSETQEDDSQRVAGDSSAAPSNLQHSGGKDASLSFTQGQLEEDKRCIKELMVQTQQDLVSVTKALLKTSGDFSAALDLLLNPSSLSASIWSLHDDSLLLSADPLVRQQLQEKYGEESVAKRMMFLEVEGIRLHVIKLESSQTGFFNTIMSSLDSKDLHSHQNSIFGVWWNGRSASWMFSRQICSNCDTITSIWTKVSEECLQNLVESVPPRIKAALREKKGVQPTTCTQ
ncbi:telomeric repeat-binding factor 2-interacting protein 1 isoform X2 [Oryzias melastigma]|uniref:telomeric repeat-binding factor 2-interacting protein 1 isoform X2 n=1 Tax=Oryzias melastigma TaxID=30732 RepID=UPI000CF800BB|nr:telomeric repeat-binding factor 2-interacting protein 1 isoform X2 [Oryzias melastigma]